MNRGEKGLFFKKTWEELVLTYFMNVFCGMQHTVINLDDIHIHKVISVKVECTLTSKDRM